MVIVLTGAGSGGHITPLLATATELKRLAPETRLVFIGQKGDSFGYLAAEHPVIDEVHLISAGKFRRYHGEGWRQLLDLKTFSLNARDLFRFLTGIYQSWRLLKRLSPSVIFIKGGFVGVPVGLAAAARKLPFVTHDSDAIPGLANRLIARWASYHAVALPANEYKNYPKDTTVTVGVPLQAEFVPVSESLQKRARQAIGLAEAEQILLVTGGGLGAQRLNNLVVKIVPNLLAKYPGLAVVHLTGQKQLEPVEAAYRQSLNPAELARIQIIGFTEQMAKFSAAADVIITRAGATTIAEFSAQRKACIIVPNPNLAAGHQLKNAELLERKQAALMVTEEDGVENRLAAALDRLLSKADERHELATNLAKLAHPEAAAKLAELLLEVARKGSVSTKASRRNNNAKNNHKHV